ncbi:MAG: LacI family transcriptional regulator [Clostridia bacterium]|nr:LacI family transcriptional regulator [Clostridia bacterium]
MDEGMGTGNDVKRENGRETPSGGCVTIRELAEAAGVSTATVSNVIHGKTKRVSPATIRRVQELIQAMGYVRGGHWEEKRPGGTRLVALLANPHKTYEEAIGADPFYGKIIGLTEQYLREKGYYMIFYSSSDMDDIFRMVTDREVEGVITLSFHKNDCDKIAGLLKRPVVSIDASGYQGKVPNIGLDDWQGGRLMTDYLLECGYGPIYVCAGRDHGVDHIRYLGCQDAQRERAKTGERVRGNAGENARGNARVQFIPLGMNREKRRDTFESLVQQVEMNIREGFRPALFCLSDLYALEAMNHFRDQGMKIPRDLGIAGFDDILYASLSRPGLTTVRQDMKRKAELAVDTLADMVEGREPAESGKEILLPVKLVVRETTAEG